MTWQAPPKASTLKHQPQAHLLQLLLDCFPVLALHLAQLPRGHSTQLLRHQLIRVRPLLQAWSMAGGVAGVGISCKSKHVLGTNAEGTAGARQACR